MREEIKLIIFLCTGYSPLPFFLFYLFLAKGKSFNEIFSAAIMDYRKYKEEKKVLLRVYPERPEKLFILIGGRKKRVVLQALDGYLKMFGINHNYQLLDISRYEKSCCKLASLMERVGLKSLPINLYKYSCRQIYRKIKD